MKIRLHEDEEVLAEYRPQARAAWYWLLTRTWHIVFLIIAVAVVIYFMFHANLQLQGQAQYYYDELESLVNFPWILWVAIIGILLAAAYLWFRTVVTAYDYKITTYRCILRYGLLALNTRVIPLTQINDLNFRASMLERLFGLGSVYIDNIGTMMSQGGLTRKGGTLNNTTRLEGLSLTECDRVMQILSQQIARAR